MIKFIKKYWVFIICVILIYFYILDVMIIGSWNILDISLYTYDRFKPHQILHYLFRIFGVTGVVLTLLFVAWRTYIDSKRLSNDSIRLNSEDEKQAREREKHIHDMFDVAVSNLGNTDNLAVRMGGVRSLVEIAKQAYKDYDDKEKYQFNQYKDFGKLAYDTLIDHLRYISDREYVNYKNHIENVLKEINNKHNISLTFEMINNIQSEYQKQIYEFHEYINTIPKYHVSNSEKSKKLTINFRHCYEFQSLVDILFKSDELAKVSDIIYEQAVAEYKNKYYNREYSEEYDENYIMLNVKYPNLTGIHLETIDFNYAYLQHVNLENASLQYVKFGEGDLSNSYLKNTNLQHVYIQTSKLVNSYFENVNLQYAVIYNSDLRNSDLYETDCQYVDFSKSKMQNTKLVHVKLDKAELEFTKLENSVVNLKQLLTAKTLYGAYICNLQKYTTDKYFGKSCFPSPWQKESYDELSSKSNWGGTGYIDRNNKVEGNTHISLTSSLRNAINGELSDSLFMSEVALDFVEILIKDSREKNKLDNLDEMLEIQNKLKENIEKLERDDKIE